MTSDDLSIACQVFGFILLLFATRRKYTDGGTGFLILFDFIGKLISRWVSRDTMYTIGICFVIYGLIRPILPD